MSIIWNDDGWTTIQDADRKKHVLEISCLAKDARVIEVRARHNDGEESYKATVRFDGKNALPMNIDRFKELYEAGKLDIK